MSDIIDIGPRLRAKRNKGCTHERASVDMKAASLTCNECDAEIDPWWWIRREAEKATSVIEEAERAAAAKIEECNSRIARANETIRRLGAEVDALMATKSRLQNEQVNGQVVGLVRRSPRRRSPAGGAS
jgi:hypothetical protein